MLVTPYSATRTAAGGDADASRTAPGNWLALTPASARFATPIAPWARRLADEQFLLGAIPNALAANAVVHLSIPLYRQGDTLTFQWSAVPP
jgi:hypothetical protein